MWENALNYPYCFRNYWKAKSKIWENEISPSCENCEVKEGCKKKTFEVNKMEI
jgi:hypothetical protein